MAPFYDDGRSIADRRDGDDALSASPRPPSRTLVSRTLLLALLALATAGCSGDEALPWHYWIAPVLFLSILGILFIALPLGYYLRVWRLKHRGR